METLIALLLTWAQFTAPMPMPAPILAAALAPLPPPDVVGLSTYYGPPGWVDGDTMRNGEPLDLTAPTVAVDDSLWNTWANADLLVFVPDCRRFLIVRATDTGWLRKAGTFRLGVRGGILRYWPVAWEEQPLALAVRVLEKPVLEQPATVWLDDRALPIVADFPSEFYRNEVACWPDAAGGPDTEEVWLWLISHTVSD